MHVQVAAEIPIQTGLQAWQQSGFVGTTAPLSHIFGFKTGVRKGFGLHRGNIGEIFQRESEKGLDDTDDENNAKETSLHKTMKSKCDAKKNIANSRGEKEAPVENWTFCPIFATYNSIPSPLA